MIVTHRSERHLGLVDVERTWEKVSDDPVDPTNNATERMIGLTFKIRSKTMRGFTSMRKVLAHPHLAFCLRAEGGVCDLRRVILQRRRTENPEDSPTIGGTVGQLLNK